MRTRAAWAAILVMLVGGPAAAEEGEKAVPERETVILLHGLARSARNLYVLAWRLESRGHRVCNVDYDTRVPTIDHAIDEVLIRIRKCASEDDRLNFVTHSLGGLVLRGLLARNALPRTGRAVMLAPPNQGSEIVDEVRSWAGFSKVMGGLAGQLGTTANDLPSRLPPPSIPFGVIAGDRWINPMGPAWLPSPHDGTVSVASTRLLGMSDHLVVPHTHTFIMNSRLVADQTDTFLRQGRFSRN